MTSASSAANRYRRLRDFRSGSIALTQLCEDTETGEHVAVKHVARGYMIRDEMAEEILKHRSLQHPNVVQFRQVYLGPLHLCIAMEYASGGDLKQLIERTGGLEENEARSYFQQLIAALHYCHQKGDVKRRIKLEHVLLDDSRPPVLKLCDFKYRHEQPHSNPWAEDMSASYVTPEQIVPDQRDIPTKSNVWTCGIILYAMLFGTYPFDREEDKELSQVEQLRKRLKRIKEDPIEIPSQPSISEELKDLLNKMMEKKPEKRISIEGLMQHPWFLKDLSVEQTNRSLHASPCVTQTEEEIRSLVEAAKTAPMDNKFDDIFAEMMDASDSESDAASQ